VTVQTVTFLVHVAYVERIFANDVLHQTIFVFKLSTYTSTVQTLDCGMCLLVVNISDRRQSLRNGCSVFSITFHCTWLLNL